MCWNQAVSLNTFLFSIFVLLLILYNNNYTQYKIPLFNNVWVYLFFASFIFMQLFEFFIWRNIHNSFYNNLFSTMALFFLIIQPIISLMMLSNKKIRNVLLMIYILFSVPIFIYKILMDNNIHSTVSKAGHLKWIFVSDSPIISPLLFIFWLFFFLFSLFYNKEWFGFLFGFLLLCISYYNYANDQTVESMWCWTVNSIMIFCVIYLLIYLPFISSNKGIC